MKHPTLDLPSLLEGNGVRLEFMTLEHEAALRAAAADGRLWEPAISAVPEPDQTRGYIEAALADGAKGTRWPFVVRDLLSDRIVGSTSYHDIVPEIRRVEIGYTWYAKSAQRSHVNTACKWLLLELAFEKLGSPVVGWRADILNLKSQAAIERLGAKKDGVIRRSKPRRDGTIRDTVMYSLTAEEWQGGIRQRLLALLARSGPQAGRPCPTT